MRKPVALWLLLSAAQAGCLGRDEVGAFLPASACDAATCAEDADMRDPRREQIEALLEQITQGEWVGEARSGGVSERCRFAFKLDGSYRVTSLAGPTTSFLLLFPAAVDGAVDGHYQVSDVVDEQYFGHFRDPFRAGIELLSELRHLSLSEGSLTFERRSIAADLSLVTTQVVLQRER